MKAAEIAAFPFFRFEISSRHMWQQLVLVVGQHRDAVSRGNEFIKNPHCQVVNLSLIHI